MSEICLDKHSTLDPIISPQTSEPARKHVTGTFEMTVLNGLRFGNPSEKATVIYTINVGGKLFQVSDASFSKIPENALKTGYIVQKGADLRDKEIFFDRDPCLFGHILNFYRFGELHMPRNVCGTMVTKELQFWGICEFSIAACCWRTYVDLTEEVASRKRVEDELQGDDPLSYQTEPFTLRESVKQTVWLFLYESSSSKLAKAWALLFYTLILLSVVCSFLEDCPEYLEWRDILVKCGFHKNDTIRHFDMPFIDFVELKYLEVINRNLNISFDTSHDFCWTGLSEFDLMRPLREIQFIVSRPNDILIAIDCSCLIFFTMEFLARFAVCPNRRELLKTMITVIDIMYLISRWGIVITNTMIPVILDYDVSLVIHRILQVFSCFRVLRIFQLGHHVKGLKYFLLTLKASIRVLVLLMFVLLIFTTVIVDMVRKFENLEQDKFQNISVGYWWAVVTMTTVGYGDFYPVTALGYLVGGLCVLLGPIIVGFFVPIISENFLNYYGYRERPIVKAKHSTINFKPEKNLNKKESVDIQSIHIVPGSKQGEKSDDLVVPSGKMVYV